MRKDQCHNLFQRLLSNYRICDINNKRYIIRNPSLDLIYQSHVLYERILYETRFEHWLRKKDCLNILIKRGLWKVNEENKFDGFNDTIDNLKVDLYKNSFKITDVNIIKKQIESVRKQLNSLYNRRYVLDSFTWEDNAESQKIEFLLVSTIYDKSGQQLFTNNDNINFVFIRNLAQELSKQKLPPGDYRTIARSDVWQTYWRIGKPNPFSCNVVELNEEQKILIMHSQMYDSVFNHLERPSDDIIDNDDMLDGWLIIKQREQKKQMAEKQVDKQIGSQHQNAQEVFIPVNSLDEAKNVNLLNDPHSRMIKKQRQQLIKQKGEVKDHEFVDKKIEIQRQALEQIKNQNKR